MSLRKFLASLKYLLLHARGRYKPNPSLVGAMIMVFVVGVISVIIIVILSIIFT